MKNYLYKFSFRLFLFTAMLCLAGNTVDAQSTYSTLVWSDEFDYEGAPDSDKWGYDIGGSGWGNNELQYYTSRSENAVVTDGKLVITVRKENYSGNGYTSARMVTKGKGDWLYGRFEIRAKLPEGRGTWPAIWMLPTDWEYGGWPASGEIDIMEHVGFDHGNVHGTVHTEAYNGMIGTQRGDNIIIPDVHEAFHEYAIEWTPDSIFWYADDELYFTFPNYGTGYKRWPYDKRFHLLLNIAVGGNWGGIEGVDDSVFPQTLEIDYVRVYQKFMPQEIQGPERVNSNESQVEFQLPGFPGAQYSWSFPEGVTITEGQGTESVMVNWGNNPGTVSVIQSYNDESFTGEFQVAVVKGPESDSLIISGSETKLGVWKENTGGGNSISISNEE